MKRLSLILAGVLIITADAFVLVSVGSNRSATAQDIELTERELDLQQAGEENSGISLRLKWIASERFQGEQRPGWLDQAKLAELGFDMQVPVTDPAAEIRYRNVLPRDVFIVLEYGGVNWEAWVKKQEAEAVKLGQQVASGSNPRSGTRLIAIDAGRDPAALRLKYPGPAKYVIVPGVVRLTFERILDFKTRKLTRSGILRGWIDRIVPDQIHVPLPQATVLSGLKTASQPHYAVTVRYGASYEPWLVDVRPM